MKSEKEQTTPQGYQLLEIIRSAGDWIDRPAIAERQGKRKLNKWDVELLARLEGLELIESQRQPMPSRRGYKVLYRAKGMK